MRKARIYGLLFGAALMACAATQAHTLSTNLLYDFSVSTPAATGDWTGYTTNVDGIFIIEAPGTAGSIYATWTATNLSSLVVTNVAGTSVNVDMVCSGGGLLNYFTFELTSVGGGKIKWSGGVMEPGLRHLRFQVPSLLNGILSANGPPVLENSIDWTQVNGFTITGAADVTLWRWKGAFRAITVNKLVFGSGDGSYYWPR